MARTWVAGAIRRLILSGVDAETLRNELYDSGKGIGYSMAVKMCAGTYTSTPTEAYTLKILKVLEKHGISPFREMAS